jgi:integrase
VAAAISAPAERVRDDDREQRRLDLHGDDPPHDATAHGAATIRFADERDKIRFDHVVPIDEELTQKLREYQHETGAIGDAWLFPDPEDPTQPVSRYVMCEWWQRLERLAGIARVKYRGWHSLRRRFATDLDGVPMKQTMSLGGWKTPITVMRYQKHTIEELRAGLAARRRVANE